MHAVPPCFAALGLTAVNPGSLIGNMAQPAANPVSPLRLSPGDGLPLPTFRPTDTVAYEAVATAASAAFRSWRLVPAGERAGLARHLAVQLRAASGPLAELLAREIGKPLSEGAGEVEAAAAYCEHAAGISTQFAEARLPSPSPDRICYERWLPLGPTAVISPFNFPLLVFAWNAVTATVCGNPVVWKPSPKAVLSALAVHGLAVRAAQAAGAPDGVFSLVTDVDGSLGERLAADHRFSLVCFTGNAAAGRAVARTVADRFGRSLLELGGMNAAIISADADLHLAVRECTASATLTAGQRCTSLRRLYVAETVYETVKNLLVAVWAGLEGGDPLDSATRLGPLVDREAVQRHHAALEAFRDRGGRILVGDRRLGEDPACQVVPALVETTAEALHGILEWFSPILCLVRYSGDLAEAIRLQNDSPYGLASAIFTRDLAEAEAFLSVAGSDCGMANVNLGTAGAAPAIAFGGEKASGGGRVAGSDSWKQFMRRMSGAVACG